MFLFLQYGARFLTYSIITVCLTFSGLNLKSFLGQSSGKIVQVQTYPLVNKSNYILGCLMTRSNTYDFNVAEIPKKWNG